jgi:hypothetical protein
MGSTNPADEISGSALDLTVLGLNSGTSMVSDFSIKRLGMGLGASYY